MKHGRGEELRPGEERGGAMRCAIAEDGAAAPPQVAEDGAAAPPRAPLGSSCGLLTNPMSATLLSLTPQPLYQRIATPRCTWQSWAGGAIASSYS